MRWNIESSVSLDLLRLVARRLVREYREKRRHRSTRRIRYSTS
jgi:hypothetical protein